MAKTITLRIADERYRRFRDAADAEERPISKYIERAAWEHTIEADFVSDEEMKEILGNKRLMKSIKRGMWEAAHMKGRLV